VVLSTHPHLVPKLKKECIYIYTPFLGHRGNLLGDVYLLPLFKVMVTMGRESEGGWEKFNLAVKCTNANYVQQFIIKLYDY